MEYRILHVEDLPSDAGLAKREISKVLDNYTIEVVESETDFITKLDNFKPHLVISDFMLPSFDGMRALKIVLERSPDIPVIMLTGSMNEDTAVTCIKAGATDYVIKEHIKRLGPAILSALEQKEIKLEQKKALQQIKLLSKSIEKSPVIVVVTDSNGDLEYVNSKFIDLTGYSADEVLGKNMRIFKSGKHAPKFYKEMWETILTGKDWKGEMQNKRKDGSLYWESVAISSMLNQEGEITHFIGIKEDITEKKQLFEELIIAKNKAEESDRLKSAFLANMSHEIRTPMNGILGFANLLKNQNLEGTKQKKYVEIINKSGQRMLNIINNIISISKIESGIMEIIKSDVNVNEQIDFAHQLFSLSAQSKNINIVLNKTLPDTISSIQTDKEKFYGVLSNLIKNAINYTQDGTIEIGYNLKTDTSSDCLSELEFYVKDTGVGIPLDRQEAIFERFIQADVADKMAKQGAGLGLSISKAYIEMLGGKIWLESKKDMGSTFYFTVPYKPHSDEVEVIENTFNSEQKEDGFSNLNILLAEDDNISEILLSLYIEEYTNEVMIARTGVEAVDICRNNPHLDLILMDIQMPELNGYEAVKQIRKFNSDIVIIAQSAFGLMGDRDRAIAAGCHDYGSTSLFGSYVILAKNIV